MSAGANDVAAVLLMGPTCSGKSALALDLAHRWPIGIVSVDSANVYRGLDIPARRSRRRRTVPPCRIT
jgi:tRNA dimethylallyltransferase